MKPQRQTRGGKPSEKKSDDQVHSSRGKANQTPIDDQEAILEDPYAIISDPSTICTLEGKLFSIFTDEVRFVILFHRSQAKKELQRQSLVLLWIRRI
jgi:hypothetical protein